MSDPGIHIIIGSEADLHTLDIIRTGSLIYITTNTRKMYEKWGTLAWDEGMARQLVEGLSAVLAGAPRAATQALLSLEENQKKLVAEAKERNRAQAPPDLSAYDDLFS